MVKRFAVYTTQTGKRIQRRKSKISGAGVFAMQAITKNSRIVDYAGEKVGQVEGDRREWIYQTHGHIWCFTINRRWVRDAHVGGNIARFINHSCKPNCYSTIKGDVVWICAGRNIRRGEELTYNYFTGGEAKIQCRCRPGCKTVI